MIFFLIAAPEATHKLLLRMLFILNIKNNWTTKVYQQKSGLSNPGIPISGRCHVHPIHN